MTYQFHPKELKGGIQQKREGMFTAALLKKSKTVKK